MRSVDQSSHVLRLFRVTWRNRATGGTYRVGDLSQLADGAYRYVYAPEVSEVPGFRPFLGFPDVDLTYESRRLWALFALRAMDPRRSDYPTYLSWLGLDERASTLDVLSRSGGERKGDSVQLVEVPRIGRDGRSSITFLVRGARYATGAPGTRDAVTALRPGQQLVVTADVGNPANPDAQMITTPDGDALGWIPDGLLDHVSSLNQGSTVLTLVRNNGTSSPWHLRFLVTLTGQVAIAVFPDGGTASS